MAKDTDNLCPALLAGKFATATIGTAPSGRCRGAKCKLWDAAEADCGLNVIKEQLKKLNKG